jgi:ABC-2 type transport system permease protein
MLALFTYEVGSRLKAVAGWAVGLTLFGALYISVYPQVEEQMMGLADLPIYQVMGMNLNSFESYLGSVMLLFVPLLLGIYAIVTGTKTLAGEEEAGTLELLMARPLGRGQIVTVKAVAIVLVLGIILLLAAFGNALVLTAVKAGFETSLRPAGLFRALMGAFPVTVAFSMLSLFLGATMPSRRGAATVATVIFVASYFGENVAGMIESLEPLATFSLFSYYDSSAGAFERSGELTDVLVLGATAVVLFGLAVVSFRTRNLMVGAWPLQHGREPRET